MHIPLYWAEYSLEFQYLNKTTKLKRFGWSDHSVADAQQHALQRCEQARDEILAGKKHIKRIESKDLNYSIPIREQILQHYPDVNAILTVNRYGASCLNVENILILDIDQHELRLEIEQQHPLQDYLKQVKQIKYMWAIILGFCAGFLASYLNYQPFLWIIAVWLFSGIIIHFLNQYFIKQVYLKRNNAIQNQIQAQNGYFGLLTSKLNVFCQHYPHLLFNIYQTPQGFRLIALNQHYGVNSKTVQTCFQRLPIDPIYQKLCLQQNTFRARVTAKPWRMQQHKLTGKPYPYFWRNNTECHMQLQQRQQWLKNYQQASQHYSACHFIQQFGHGKMNKDIQSFIQLHDQLCQANQKLPLA